MTRRHAAVLGVIVSIAVFGTACEDNPVGRICDLGSAAGVESEIVVASPSLDCVSRTCLRVVSARPMCTAECSLDEDCDRVPESPCITGFTCGIAVSAGPFCCKKFCICKDFVVLPDSGELEIPEACNPDIAANECCNLPNRVDNPQYPLCKS